MGMGKIGGSSSSSSKSNWFTAVRKAFSSPTKKITNTCTATTDISDANNKTSSSKRREAHDEQDDDEEKKRGKRRWMSFSSSRKSSSSSSSTTGTQQQESTTTVILHHCGNGSRTAVSNSPAEQAANKQRHALAVAMATTAAAQAAVATAQAAVEVVRLTNPSLFVKQHFAAVLIQTAFRGYLGRKALRGLKGVVKLQALVRGQNVRKRAKLTLHCIQSLLRVQAQVLHHRGSTTATGGDLPNNRSLEQCFRDGDSYRDNYDAVDDDDDQAGGGNQAAMEEEIRSILQQTRQLWRGSGGRERELVRYASEGEVEEGGSQRLPQPTNWENRWRRRASCDSTAATSIKTVEMDSRSLQIRPKQSPHRRRQSNSPASPLHNHHHPISSPKLPPPAQAGAAGVHSRSGSPRFSGSTMVPSYMAATESAKARLRSQSAPKQRNSVSSPSPTHPSNHNRDQPPSGNSSGTTTTTAKKRLYFPAPPHAGGDYDYDVEYRSRSPSYNRGAVVLNMEQRSKMSSSSCTDSVITGTDEIISSSYIDPATNHEVTRWLLR